MAATIKREGVELINNKLYYFGLEIVDIAKRGSDKITEFDYNQFVRRREEIETDLKKIIGICEAYHFCMRHKDIEAAQVFIEFTDNEVIKRIANQKLSFLNFASMLQTHVAGTYGLDQHIGGPRSPIDGSRKEFLLACALEINKEFEKIDRAEWGTKLELLYRALSN
jgi:hypothetical protein